VRFLASLFMWARHRRAEHRVESGWREQLRFCGPAGAATVLITLNKSMGSLYVAKMLGPIGLAHYSIGTYMRPIITVLRNSLSDALLPEMSQQQGSKQQSNDPLQLWRRMTTMAALMLIPAAVLLSRFADTIVVTLFSEEYRPAVPVFQIYLLVLFREIVDFAVPLRSMNRTAPIMYSNMVSIVLNAIFLTILLPTVGLLGAAWAFIISRMVEGTYLGWQTARIYQIPARTLINWADLGKVALAAAVASVTLVGSFWTSSFGLFGALAASCCFMLVYVPMLLLLRLPEALLLKDRLPVRRALARLRMSD
jgi:O-antigen/teichoic acid export membrane protein